MASIPWHRAGVDPIQLSVSQVGPLDELQEDASLPPCFVSASWRHLPSSVCTGDGINELCRLKPGCFAGLWAAARSHTDFCRMSSEMSPIWLVFGTKVVQNAFCPQIGPFRGHFAEMLSQCVIVGTLAAIHRAGGEPNWDSCEAIRDARWLQFRGIERGRTRYSYL